MSPDHEPDKKLLPLKIIWLAMLMPLVIYLLLGLFAVPMMGTFAEHPLEDSNQEGQQEDGRLSKGTRGAAVMILDHG